MFIIGDQDGQQRGNAWHGQETMSNEEQMRKLGMINFTKRRQRKGMVSLLRYSKTCQVEKVARFVLRYPGRQTKVSYLKVNETNLSSAKEISRTHQQQWEAKEPTFFDKSKMVSAPRVSSNRRLSNSLCSQ